MPLEILDPLFQDPRFTSADGRKKAEARQKLWGGYLLADPAAAARFEQLPDDQRQQVVEEFYKRADERYRDAFTVEVTPERVEKYPGRVDRDTGHQYENTVIIPAQRRPVYDQASEDFIAQVKEGKVKPDAFSRAELLSTGPVVLEAAPEQLPLWQARAKQVAVEAGVLPADDTWQQTAARIIGTLGGVAGPAVAATEKISEWTGMRDLEEGAFRALTPENRALVALAYPDADAFKTAGTLLSLGGASAGFGTGLGKIGIAALSRQGIALQAGADAALGYAYRHEAPGLLAAAAGRPDDGALNTVEAGLISGLFGVALRSVDHAYTLAQLRETVGFQGDMTAFRDFLKRQGERLSPPVDTIPTRRGPLQPAEEGAAVPMVSPDELQGIAMPTAPEIKAQLGDDAAPLIDKARATAEKAAINGEALQRLQEWPKDTEIRALIKSEATPGDIADALVHQKPGEPLPIAIKDGDAVVGGSIPAELPSVRAGDTTKLFSEDDVPFNLASETRADTDKATQAAFDRASEAQKQGKLFEQPAELPPDKAKPPAVKPAVSDAASSSDSIAEQAGGRTGEQQVDPIPPKVKPARAPGPGLAPDGEQDLLSHIAELGGIGGPGKTAGGEYDGWAETFNRGPARLLRRKGASSVDQLMGELADRGYRFASADQFYSAVNKAVETRATVRGAIAKETHQAKFTAALFENAGRPAELKAPKPRASDELKVGDTFKVRGEPVRVTEVNPDTGAARIEGAMDRWIEPGQPIYPDRGVIKTPKAAKAAAGGATPFNIEQATLPRRISAPLITGDAAEPVSLASIREYLSKALDIPMRVGVNRQHALGFFRTKAENIRLKMINDIPTVAHEVGHYLHKIVFPGPGAATSAGHDAYTTFAKQFDGELLQLGAKTSRQSYSQQQIRMEGVAEFVREYLTDRSGALAKAPKFTGHFEGALKQDYPEIWKIVSKAREDLGRYINQTPAMKVRAAISRAPVQPGLSVGQRLEKFYSDWVTELRPIERHLQRMVELGLPADQAKAVSAAATNYVGGWRGKVEHDLLRAQTDLAGRKVGEPLREILRGLDDNARTELGDYMVAKRALELGRRGIRSGIATPDAMATVQLYQPKYERTRIKLLGFQDRNLQLLEQSGYFTPQQIARMRELNQDYVPFYRVYESVMGGGGRSGRGFVNAASGVKRIKGSDRLIVDPLESIVRNAYTFRDLAERNLIGRKFVAAVEMTPGGGRVADQVVKRITGTHVPDAEIRKALLAAGLEEEVIDELPDLTFTLWKAARTEDPGKGIFKIWKNGKEQFYQTDDKELVRSLLLMDSADAELMSKFPFANTLRALTRIKRAGATLGLEFIARNPFRDQIQAAVYSKYGFVPFFDGFRGMMSAMKKDQYYWDWIKSGGRYSDFIARDRADLVKTLKNVTAEPSVTAFIKETANPLNVLQTLQKVSEMMEMGTRLGEFRRGIKAGASPVDAANASKDISLNFARAGFKGKVWNQMRCFFNASVQDPDKFVVAHKANPGRTAAKAFAYITMPSIGVWYLAKDDPEMQKLPEWRKMLFWNFNMTDVAEATGMKLQAPLIVSLPKPFLLGSIYGNSVEKALDYAHERDPNALRKWFAEVYSQLPANPSMFVPDAGLPIIENVTNYSFFRQGPIVGQSLQGLPAEFQSTPQTSQLAQLLGKSTGTSPLMIDNAVRGYGAGLSKYATDGIDWFLAKTNLRDVPVAPEKMVRELPGVRAFVGSPYAAAADVDRFYAGMTLAEQRLRAFSYFGKEISTDSEKTWWDKNRNQVVYYDQKNGERSTMTELRAIQTNLSELSKAMVLVQENRTLSAETKRTRLLELKRQRDTVAAAGFKMLHPTDQRDAK